MNTKLPRYFDSVISVIAVFLLSYYFLSGYENKTVLFLFSTSFAFSFTALWTTIYYRAPKKEDYSYFSNTLSHRTNDENARALAALLPARYNAITSGNRIFIGKRVFVCYFRLNPLTAQEAVDFALNCLQETVLLVISADKNAKKEVSLTEKPLVIADVGATAKLLKAFGTLPVKETVPLCQKLLKAFSCALDAVNAKRYLSAAGIMLFLSAINRFSAYYFAFAVILLVLSAVSFFKGKMHGKT